MKIDVQFGDEYAIQQAGRAYQREVCAELVGAGIREPLTGPLAVEVILHAPDRRRRDLDNLGKALLDALTKAGVYWDDSQIDDLRIRRGDLDAERPRVVVTVREQAGGGA